MKNWKIKFIAIPDFFPTLYYIDLLLAQFILKFHPSYLDTFLSLLFLAGNLHVGSFPGGTAAKNLNANTGDTGLILGSGRSLGEGNGNPFQHSCLGNPMDRGAPRTPGGVLGVTKNWEGLSNRNDKNIHVKCKTV